MVHFLRRQTKWEDLYFYKKDGRAVPADVRLYQAVPEGK